MNDMWNAFRVSKNNNTNIIQENVVLKFYITNYNNNPSNIDPVFNSGGLSYDFLAHKFSNILNNNFIFQKVGLPLSKIYIDDRRDITLRINIPPSKLVKIYLINHYPATNTVFTLTLLHTLDSINSYNETIENNIIDGYIYIIFNIKYNY